MLKRLMAAAGLAATAIIGFAPAASAQQGKPVPEIDFMTWPAADYQHFYETSALIAEEWRKLGLEVKLKPISFPNPMLSMWFKEHAFDAMMSGFSGSPLRLEPDFFTNAQFHSKYSQPGNWNVGEYSNPKVDELGEKQLGVYDREERRKLIWQLQEELDRDPPEAVIAYEIDTYAVNTNNVEVTDYKEGPEGIRAAYNLRHLKAKHDGPIRIGWTASYSTLNPLSATSHTDLAGIALIYDTLVQIEPDGNVALWLAEAIDVIDDKTFEITIRGGHSFSDGKPVTVEDVKFSFDYLKKWESAYFQKYLDRLQSVEVIGERKLRFVLSEPYAPFVLNTLGQVFVLPKHVWDPLVEKLGIARPQDFTNDQPVGSGAFRLKYIKEGQEAYLEANSNHFSPPKSDLLMIAFGSAEVVLQSLLKGEIDVSYQPLVPTAISQYETAGHIRLVAAKLNGYISVRYKVTGPVFGSTALRNALRYAIPYDRIVNDIYAGRLGRTATPIVPTNAFWHNSQIPLPVYAPDKARAILKDAGFTWDGAGRLHFPPS